MCAAIAIRVDASPQIGIGHVIRCLTLADALCQRGASVRFVSRHLPESLHEMVTRRGHSCVAVDTEPSPAAGELAHSHWLGTDQLADAHDTIKMLKDVNWDWVVVDHYALDAHWETRLRTAARRIMVIDDLADRIHACDVLLDQNYLAEGERRYLGKVPSGCQLLVGPRYALMRAEYRDYRRALRPKSGPIRRVLVSFGGMDVQNMTGLSLDALSEPGLRHLHVDVVCGSDPSRRLELVRRAAQRPGTVIHGPRPHLADLMSQADLALGGAGSTTWERMCLGLPSLVITLADNQIPVSQWLAREGLIRLVGHATAVTVTQLRDVLLNEIERDRPTGSVERGMQLSDGLGVSRVVDTMQRSGPC